MTSSTLCAVLIATTNWLDKLPKLRASTSSSLTSSLCLLISRSKLSAEGQLAASYMQRAVFRTPLKNSCSSMSKSMVLVSVRSLSQVSASPPSLDTRLGKRSKSLPSPQCYSTRSLRSLKCQRLRRNQRSVNRRWKTQHLLAWPAAIPWRLVRTYSKAQTSRRWSKWRRIWRSIWSTRWALKETYLESSMCQALGPQRRCSSRLPYLLPRWLQTWHWTSSMRSAWLMIGSQRSRFWRTTASLSSCRCSVLLSMLGRPSLTSTKTCRWVCSACLMSSRSATPLSNVISQISKKFHALSSKSSCQPSVQPMTVTSSSSFLPLWARKEALWSSKLSIRLRTTLDWQNLMIWTSWASRQPRPISSVS